MPHKTKGRSLSRGRWSLDSSSFPVKGPREADPVCLGCPLSPCCLRRSLLLHSNICNYRFHIDRSRQGSLAITAFAVYQQTSPHRPHLSQYVAIKRCQAYSRVELGLAPPEHPMNSPDPYRYRMIQGCIEPNPKGERTCMMETKL